MKRLTVMLAAAAIALAGCAGAAPGEQEELMAEDPVETPTATQPAEDAIIEAPAEREGAGEGLEAETISGAFGGDAQLEGGCAWLDAGAGRFEVIYPPDYRIEWGPVRLIGPDGEVVAQDGDEITLTGARAEDLMSLCQVGVIFEATDVQAGGGS